MAALGELATLGEVSVIPALLPLISAEDRLGKEAARTVTALGRDLGAAELAWIDEQARRGRRLPEPLVRRLRFTLGGTTVPGAG